MNSIAIVSGGFDPIHIGHLRMFQASAELGGLAVILNSDEWLIRKKGKYFMTWAHRAEIIQEFSCVDFVTPVDDSDDSVCEALKALHRIFGNTYELIFCNGGDRKADNVPEHILCEKIGIECAWNVGGDKIESSSELVKRYGQV
jgi:D-beta-D-heptose 7-phosphate kinase/D-beta-D-heptose 1-phosphate adenosyltransferase